MPDQKLILRNLNIAAGGLGALASLTQLLYIFSRFNVFLLGVASLMLSMPIIFLEFREVPSLSQYCNVYYNFLGRGALYIILSFMLMFGGFFKIMTCFVLFGLGGFNITCHFNGNIDSPDSFRSGAGGININDDDDDEVV